MNENEFAKRIVSLLDGIGILAIEIHGWCFDDYMNLPL